MSDMSIRQVQASPDRIANVSSAKTVNTVNADISIKADSQQIQSQENEKNEKAQKKTEIENVVSVSEHGDTVQVSREGFSRLEEDEELGRIVVKSDNAEISAEEKKGVQSTVAEDRSAVVSESGAPVDSDAEKEIFVTDEQKERRKEILEQTAKAKTNEKSDDSSASIGSYAGYTNSQLEQLYLKGEISKIDYDREVESREERKEALKDDDNEFAKQMAKNIAGEDDASRTADEIKKAFSTDASDTLTASDRLSIIRAMENIDAEQGSH